MNTCNTCRFWDSHHEECQKIVTMRYAVISSENYAVVEAFADSDDAEVCASLRTSPAFGCTLHEFKTTK